MQTHTAAQLLPPEEEVLRWVAAMRAPDQVRAAIVEARAGFAMAPASLRQGILDTAAQVAAGLGIIGAEVPSGVSQDPASGPTRLYGDVLALLACVPSLLAYHAERGVPEDVTWDTLSDLPRHVARYERLHGRPGFSELRWLSTHLRGLIYSLGRLQFERIRAIAPPDDHAAVVAATEELAEDDVMLNVHIPETGPLDPGLCEAAYAQAIDRFAAWYPDERPRAFVCVSWLMDPQLRDYLPSSSNIIRFQDRFDIVGPGREASGSMQEFVFGRAGQVDLEDLPQRTSLERGFVQHLRAGGTWYARTGWFSP
jgi:GNAT domain-containint protein/N-acyltransferase family protein